MAVPRPVLFALLGLALIAGVFVVTRQSSNGAGTVAAAPAPAPAPHAPAAPKAALPAPAHRAVTPKPAATAAKPAAPAKPSAVAASDAKLQPIATVLAKGDVAVVLFAQTGSADDSGTTAAVASLRGMHGVSIFHAGIADLPAYSPLIASAGISQVPAVVVMRKGKQARVVQGFVDPDTLRQTVTDAQG